jgi:putative DNA primase/helicase
MALTNARKPRSGPTAVYTYTDNFGEPVYRKVRYDNPKRFTWEAKDVKGEWKAGLNGATRYLYRLPELISSAAERVWIPEGEKDAESLRGLGLTATTCGGAMDPWLPAFNKYLAGRDVVILTDADGPGWARGDVFAEALLAVAKSVRVISFVGVGLPDHSDVTDWLEAGHTRQELEVLADATPPVQSDDEEQANRVSVDHDDRLTEAGAAERFARLHGDDLRFDHRRDQWLIWGPHRWRRDTNGAITRLGLEFSRRWQREALEIEDLQKREITLKAAIRLEKRDALASMLALAHDLKPIADPGDGWDLNPHLLGVPNGVVDLRDGRLQAGHRGNKITLSTSVAYDPDARSNLWDGTLKAILLQDELIDFFQAAIGYSATGDTSQDLWFLGCGGGRNGKGTLAQPTRTALGDYALELPSSIFDLKAERAPYELARLPGRRLVMSSESGDTIRLNHDRIKQLSGGDVMSAANKYERPFEFQPACKLWLFCNKKPRVTDDTGAFWSRVVLLPFTVSFIGKEDHTLRPKLTQEPTHQAAVLAWIVRGAVRYFVDGLGHRPQAVLEATKDYRDDQDVLGPFLEQACELAPAAESGASDLYEHYLKWADRQHLTTKERLTASMFGRIVGGKFKSRKDRITGVRLYAGIAIKGLFS